MRADLAQDVVETLSCPACASGSSVEETAARPSRYGVRQCLNCHLLFSDPMVGADSTWYSSSWLYELREDNAKLDGRKRAVPWNFEQALFALDPRVGSDLLDVGCAEGHFLWLAQKAGFKVTGLDFNPQSLKIAKDVFGISAVHQCSVEELALRFPETSFDVVTMFEVLEHTTDPFATLCSLNRVLKPGGQLCISVPGFRRWPVLFHPEVDSPPHHLTLWTDEALQKLLARAGFRPLAVCAKPLRVEDLGVHMKWRLQELLRKPLRSHSSETPHKKSSLAGWPPGISRSTLVQGMARGGLAPICWALRFNPKAGGFTLFANCQKI